MEGTQCHHLRIQFNDGRIQDWFIDAESGLPVKKTAAAGRFEPQAWFFFDYREVGGIKFPHNVELEEGLFTRVHLFDHIETNVGISDTLFEIPEG